MSSRADECREGSTEARALSYDFRSGTPTAPKEWVTMPLIRARGL